MKLITGLSALVLMAPATLALLVTDLTSKNFDSLIDGSNNVLVMFYAKNCGHCANLEPEFDAVAEILSAADEILLVRANSDTEPELKRRFEITGIQC